MKVGLLGGSFDPIHLGHLIMAEQCREQAGLDQIWFVPAATAPHKRGGASATGKQRLEMITLAIAGHEHFYVSTTEQERGDVSYTVDTLRQFHRDHPNFEWFLILGGDSLAQLATWREPEEICRLAWPLLYARPSETNDPEALRPLVTRQRFDAIASLPIRGPMVDISSTAIRDRVAAGRSIRYLLPRAVEIYIQNQKLYKS